MKIEAKEIKSKEIWESFLKKCGRKTFLCSWNWGDFQEKDAKTLWRLGFLKNNNLIAVALVIFIHAKRGRFLFVPHGPVIESDDLEIKTELFNTLFLKLKELAKSVNADFIRISPILKRSEENESIFKKMGFKNAPIHMHPEVTWELDISKNEDALMADMRKTTRYLIRQAQKNKDIEIVKSCLKDDLKEFKKIYDDTAKRHGFVPFSLDYLKNQFDSFSTDSQIVIFLGKYKKEVVSSVIIVFWQNMAFYHHGASLVKFNKIPVSYLLQWEAIKEAKGRGCVLYNFWGIAPEMLEKKPCPDHPWTGLSVFKMGFGGYGEKYVKTQDYLLSFKYYLNYIVEKIRKVKRRY